MSSDLLDLLLRHPRSKNQWIGLEVERFIMRGSVFESYDSYLRQKLENLRSGGLWRTDYESDGKLLGLKQGFHTVSLEPGSQFELSPAPARTIFEAKQLFDTLDQSISLESEWYLCLGLYPDAKPEDRTLLPSPRYALMDAHFKRLKNTGPWMMRLTCGFQINFDFETPDEGVEMYQAALKIAPILLAWLANSPYQEGRRSHLSSRYMIWDSMEADRCQPVPGSFDPFFKLSDYVNFVGRIPLMYWPEHQKIEDPKGKNSEQIKSERDAKNISVDSWLSVMRQYFGPVRFKPCCVEIRYLDQLPSALRWSAAALLTGLIYDRQNRAEILSKPVTSDSFRADMQRAAKRGLQDDEFYEAALDLLAMAEEGLLRRDEDEVRYLSEVEECLRLRRSPAEDLVSKIGDSWSYEHYLSQTPYRR